MIKQRQTGAPDVLSFGQAARYAGLSRPTFRRHLVEIPHRRAGRRILITRAALTRWLEGIDDSEAQK